MTKEFILLLQKKKKKSIIFLEVQFYLSFANRNHYCPIRKILILMKYSKILYYPRLLTLMAWFETESLVDFPQFICLLLLSWYSFLVLVSIARKSQSKQKMQKISDDRMNANAVLSPLK
jgi:hypothetical protein